MKYFILLSICWLVFCGNVCAQSKAIDFYAVMTTIPVGKNTTVTEIVNNDSQIETTQKRLVYSKKYKRQIKPQLDLMGEAIDSLQLINYKSDTIYVLSTLYLPAGTSSMTIKTQKETFNVVQDRAGAYFIQYLYDSYANIPEDIRVSDSLLYKAIFTWDVDLLIRLIKSSGEVLGSEYFMSATRIILNDNQVVKKDVLNFKPALRWHL